MPKSEQERDRFRDGQEWRKWYRTSRWQKLRWKVLVRDGFRCAICGRVEGDTSQLVADHKKKHGGNMDRFFDESGLQTLCKPCHDGTKQSDEKRNTSLDQRSTPGG